MLTDFSSFVLQIGNRQLVFSVRNRWKKSRLCYVHIVHTPAAVGNCENEIISENLPPIVISTKKTCLDHLDTLSPVHYDLPHGRSLSPSDDGPSIIAEWGSIRRRVYFRYIRIF